MGVRLGWGWGLGGEGREGGACLIAPTWFGARASPHSYLCRHHFSCAPTGFVNVASLSLFNMRR